MKLQHFLQIGAGLTFLCASPVVQAELIAAWSFEEEEPGIVKDITGNGFDGTIIGQATYVDGVSGKGMAFDGESAYVEIANSSDDSRLNLTSGSYTITCWVMLNHVEGIQRMINRDSGEDFSGGYSLSLVEKMIRVDTNHGKQHTLNAATVLPNTWRFFAIIYDKTSGYRTVYVNGELIARDQIGHDGMRSRPADQLWFGAIPKYGQYFSGVLDEVRIYDEALTDAQISALIADPSTDGAKP